MLRDGSLVGSVDGSCFTFIDKPPKTSFIFNYSVCAANKEGQESQPSNKAAVRTAEAATPAAPSNLTCIRKAANW